MIHPFSSQQFGLQIGQRNECMFNLSWPPHIRWPSTDLLQLAKLRLAPPSLVKHRLLLLLIVPSLLHSSKKNLTFGFVKGRIRDRISQIWFLLELLQNLFATLHILEVPLLISPLSTKQFASDKPHSKWIRNFFGSLFLISWLCEIICEVPNNFTLDLFWVLS